MARLTVSQQRAVDDLLKTLAPEIEKAFRDAIARIVGRVNVAELAKAIEAKDLYGVAQVLRVDQADFWRLEESLRGGFMGGGALTEAALPALVRGVFSFNGRHMTAEGIIRLYAAERVQGIAEDTMVATRRIVLDAVQTGRPSRAAALDLVGRLNRVTGQRVGGIIGLTAEQAEYVISARAELTRLDASYFRRKRRDTTLDKLVKRAIKEGKPLSQADLDRVVDGYKSRLLQLRGETIAKNEAAVSIAMGREEGIRQAIASGKVEKATVRWQHNLSTEPRADHVAMGSAGTDGKGKVINFGEYFDFGDVKMKHPHDPVGGAKHSINCRCTAIYRVFSKLD